MSKPKSSSSSLTKRVRAILNSRGLTLADVSRSSQRPGKGGRRKHVPHNLYEAIEKRGFTPSLHQLSAIAELTGYSFTDWLGVFGFSLASVTRLQASFENAKTVELDMRVYHPSTAIPWFRDIDTDVPVEPFTPLSRWIAPASPTCLSQILVPPGAAQFCYVKIGSQDNYAYPDLLPGSIARFKCGADAVDQVPLGRVPTNALFLVEHSKGLVCSRLFRPKPDRIILCSRDLPFAPVELEVGSEASVRGIADLEIRPLSRTRASEVPLDLGRFWTPVPLARHAGVRHVGELIRKARFTSGLSFRKASRRTLRVAEILGDWRYFCSPGSLSDCEAHSFPPRHIHKLLSICAVYFISVADLLKTCGIDLDTAGALPIPDELMEMGMKAHEALQVHKDSEFLRQVQLQFVEFPISLYGSLGSLFGLPEISLRDLFWLGNSFRFLNPSVAGARFFVVDRKRRVPQTKLTATIREQPLYVLERRDGTFFCGSCALDRDAIVVRPWTAGMPKLLRLRDRVDVEIVGEVIGIVRQFG